MVNSGSTLLLSNNKWHSTATHTSSSNMATHGDRHRPSIPLSDISTNMNTGAMTTISRKCIYVKEGSFIFKKNQIFASFYFLVISVNNSATHLPLVSSDNGSASECESGELSSDEYPSQIKRKLISIRHCQENRSDSTQEMGTLAQLLNHSFPTHLDISMASPKFV